MRTDLPGMLVAIWRCRLVLAWLSVITTIIFAPDTCNAQSEGVAVDKISGRVVHYRIADGYAIVHGMIIGRATDIEANGLTMPQPLSDSRSDAKELYVAGTRPWPGGIVPIAIEPSIDGATAALIADAVAEYSDRTLVKFVPYYGLASQPNYILFQYTESGCGYSQIGMQGGQQTIVLTPPPPIDKQCVETEADVIHEMMHALGFGHEHQRSDRDSYVTINANCLDSSLGADFLETNVTNTYPTVPYGAYDYSSVMHYPRYGDGIGFPCETIHPTQTVEISVPGYTTCGQLNTFVPDVPGACPAPPMPPSAYCAPFQSNGLPDIGQKCGLSAGDSNAINHFYAPPPPPPPNIPPQVRGMLAQTVYKLLSSRSGPSTGSSQPDLNQHGLTGSWYETTTGGQGIEVEIFADPSAGSGSTFVSWFTFDTAAGGADHQRWYTAQGPVVTGQPTASLTIYQNVDGNFNAPPATTAAPVGTATLNFSTCTSGQFSYSFTDGTGRMGNVALTRLTDNVTCSTTTPYPTNADFALSGNWYGGPATGGQGFTIEVNPITPYFFAAWYTYAPSGATAGAAGQRWYTAQGAFTPGLRSIPVTIYETTGGVFDKPDSIFAPRTVAVGTGTLAFQSCIAAAFSYNFTGGSGVGLSGIIPLSRVGPVPPGCTS